MSEIGSIDLDGMGEAEARNLRIMVEPQEKYKPGCLRAAGTRADGQPHDLSKAAAYDDFVDVTGGRWHWVALRANGQTVSSDGKADLTGIQRIASSVGNEYGFIDYQGHLHLRADSTLSLPAALDSVRVVGAALGFDHGLALLDDQTAVAFGARYEGTVGNPANPQPHDTPRWPPPPEKALQQVAAVAATAIYAATLHTDGTLSIWGCKGKVLWNANPHQKRLRTIRGCSVSFWALDEADQLWRLDVHTNPSPDRPVYTTANPTLMQAGVTHLGKRCWLREDGLWFSTSNFGYLSALLNRARLPPGVAFSARSGTSNGVPFASLLWIEPAATH